MEPTGGSAIHDMPQQEEVGHGQASLDDRLGQPGPLQPELRLDVSFVVPIVVAVAGIAVLLVRLGVTAQRQEPVTGEAGLIGRLAMAITSIEPGGIGHVKLRGELWRASAEESIAAGARVVVTRVDGLTLVVRQTHTERT